ncbi:MAG: MmcQ/YjbR family DNA-binding protein [Acutalibacteraceae bacterium]
MTLTELMAYCFSKNGAYEDHPFGPEPTVIKVKPENGKGKIFAQLFVLHGQETVTFNCTREQGEQYRMLFPGVVTRGYHCPPVQQPYFNTLPLDGAVPDEVIFKMADESYETAVGKMPKYAQNELLG